MKILVTGLGFLGRHLLPKLTKLPGNNEIAYTCHRGVNSQLLITSNLLGTSFYCDLSNSDDIKKIYSYFQPDVIYHLAGRATVKSDEREIMQSNVDTTHLLLKNLPRDTKPAFVLASSIIVHGDKKDRVNDFDIPDHPTSIYGISKLAAEKLVWKYHNDGLISGKILRLVGNVGIHSTHGLVHDICNKLKSYNPNLELIGDCPGSVKGFVHADDTADAMIMAANNKNGWFCCNVGQTDELTVEQVAYIAMKASKVIKPIKWLGAAANWKNDNSWLGCESDVIRYLGWNPKYNNSAEAIEAVVKEKFGLI